MSSAWDGWSDLSAVARRANAEGGSDTHQLHFVEVMDFAQAQRIQRIDDKTAQVICPSGGLLTGLSSLISDFPKNISVPTHPKSDLELFASHPTRGAYHVRHGRGEGCGGRGSVLRAMDGRAGWRKACERSPSVRTRDVAAYGEVVWS